MSSRRDALSRTGLSFHIRDCNTLAFHLVVLEMTMKKKSFRR
jgi:hypothetical protein